MSRWLSYLGCLWVAGAALAGCGPKDEFDYGSVTGTVTYNGAPVEGAAVAFNPASGRTAIGTTDAQGKYTLMTGNDEGCTIGNFTVTISKTTRGSSGPTMPAMAPQSPDSTEPPSVALPAGQEGTGQPPAPGEVQHQLPEKYADLLTTPLTAEVKAGENTFDFALTDD